MNYEPLSGAVSSFLTAFYEGARTLENTLNEADRQGYEQSAIAHSNAVALRNANIYNDEILPGLITQEQSAATKAATEKKILYGTLGAAALTIVAGIALLKG